MMWYDKSCSSCSPSESSDSESKCTCNSYLVAAITIIYIILFVVDIPCTSMHGQSTYAPVASTCTPLTYSESPAWYSYTNQMLPPFNPLGFTPPTYSSPMNIDEAAITIKKEPNYMHSPTGLYPEHPYHQEHFPFPPICKPPLRHISTHGKL